MSAADHYAPRFDVRIAGLTLASDVSSQVTSVSYDSNLDVADMFTVTLRNPDNQLTDSALFDLGKTVEVHMGYGDDLQPMMLGEITAIHPSFPQSGAPSLTISGYDRSYRLRHNEPDRTYRGLTDSLIAAQIAVEAGLIPIVDPTVPAWEELPHTGSDMAFLKDRARANNFDVFVHWDRLYFRFPRLQTAAYALEWGKNLSSFSPRLSSAETAGIQIVRGYDERLAQTILGVALAADLDLDNIIERLGSQAVELLMAMGRRVVRTEKIESPIDAAKLAHALLQEILEGMYEASGNCIGIPDLRAGAMISIKGVGKRFSGKYRLRKVNHTIDEGGYRTSFDVTQSAGTTMLQLLRKTLVDSPSPTKREPFYGVTVGKVLNNLDLASPPSRGRVQLQLPHFSDTAVSPWARCVTPMAGRNRGFYFLPDIGDEVLVAFESGDVSKPVVMGSLWNGPSPPPVTNDVLNMIREIKTGAGHTIILDDTPGAAKVTIKSIGHQITLDDTIGGDQVSIRDVLGHEVKLSATALSITTGPRAGGPGHTLLLDDTEGAARVTIKTGAGHQITLDDGIAAVSIKDASGHEVKLNATGIELATSPGELHPLPKFDKFMADLAIVLNALKTILANSTTGGNTAGVVLGQFMTIADFTAAVEPFITKLGAPASPYASTKVKNG